MSRRELLKILKKIRCFTCGHDFLTAEEWQLKEKPFWDSVPTDAMSQLFFKELNKSLNKIGSCKVCGVKK